MNWKKRHFREKRNIENFVVVNGVGQGGTFFLTLTCAEDVEDILDITHDWNITRTLLNNPRYRRMIVGNNAELINAEFKFIRVPERQLKRGEKYNNAGAWHFHMVGCCKGWSNNQFRQLLALVIRVSGVRFGFFNLKWTSGTPRKVANYMSKYLTKFDEKGVRMVSYSRGAERMVKGAFTFLTEHSRVWWGKLREIHGNFPCFKRFYWCGDVPYEDKMRAVDYFHEGRFRDFVNILLKYSNRYLVHSEWENFRSKTLFECV